MKLRTADRLDARPEKAGGARLSGLVPLDVVCGLIAGEPNKLKSARHDKLKMLQHNKLKMNKREKLKTARRKGL